MLVVVVVGVIVVVVDVVVDVDGAAVDLTLGNFPYCSSPLRGIIVIRTPSYTQKPTYPTKGCAPTTR